METETSNLLEEIYSNPVLDDEVECGISLSCGPNRLSAICVKPDGTFDPSKNTDNVAHRVKQIAELKGAMVHPGMDFPNSPNILNGEKILNHFKKDIEELADIGEILKDTYGEKAVGSHFIPFDSPKVLDINIVRNRYAQIIDALNDYRKEVGQGEAGRLASIAITEAQTACMWAVKALSQPNE